MILHSFSSRLTAWTMLALFASSTTLAQPRRPQTPGETPATPPAAGAPAPRESAGPSASRPGPKPYKDVITAKAISRKGLFTVHKVDDKYYFEIPDALFGREIMAVTRFSRVAGGAGVYGGELANQQVKIFSELLAEDVPLVGVEPSAILGFRDEYPALVDAKLQDDAKRIAKHVFLFEEWFMLEADRGKIQKEQFTDAEQQLKVHGHCHQKALSSMTPVKRALSFPRNYEARLIPSGCCGMAGSFGYEKEHYDISMQVGELVLFKSARELKADHLLVAAGTSCRHQIKDGTGRKSYHPIEVLYTALKK